jgi:hypothetical protein
MRSLSHRGEQQLSVSYGRAQQILKYYTSKNDAKMFKFISVRSGKCMQKMRNE